MSKPNSSAQIWKHITESQLVVLLSPQTPEECVAFYELLEPLGVVLEVALRDEAALPGIAAIRQRHPEALLLAGTVMTRAQAEAAIDAGAAGIVSADYIPEVVEACVGRDVLCIPGGVSDAGKQLVQKASLYGCDLVELRERYPYQWVYKLFPAVAAGNLDLVAPLRAVYPGLRIVYTGGVTAADIPRILDRDPEAIICGSAISKHRGDPDRIRAEAGHWRDLIRGQRPGPAPRAARRTGTIVTFGEIMLRLSSPLGTRLGLASAFDVTYGGAEANVAASLAQFGHASRFVSAVPDHALGEAALQRLQALGVDTQHVLRTGSRLGIYFLEPGASQRSSRILYDRTGSAFAEISPGRIDWSAVFADAAWFHWTGITPAVSENAQAALREGLEAARAAGVRISVDLNYRAHLWSRDRARATLAPLMASVDVAIANEADAHDVFGIRAGTSDPETGKLDLDGYRDVCRQLIDRFGLEAAAITLRESTSASDNTWSGCLHDGAGFHHSYTYPIRIVDRVGAGDAFAAGLIHGLIRDLSPGDALEFAVAAAALKHTFRGDFNPASVEEVSALAAGDRSGRVKR